MVVVCLCLMWLLLLVEEQDNGGETTIGVWRSVEVEDGERGCIVGVGWWCDQQHRPGDPKPEPGSTFYSDHMSTSALTSTNIYRIISWRLESRFVGIMTLTSTTRFTYCGFHNYTTHIRTHINQHNHHIKKKMPSVKFWL